MSERKLERIVDATGAGGLSALIALRALAEADDGANAVERERWLTGVREQYRRWYGDGSQGPDNFTAPETMRYLAEQVVHQLDAAGIAEFLAHADGEPVPANNGAPWEAVRLSPWALAELRETGAEPMLAHMDARIRTLVEESHGAQASAASPGDAVAAADDGFGFEAEARRGRRQSMLVPGGLTLSAKGLMKAYRGRKVVNDVDVHVSQGEIVGLLGPNGAGKTTSFYQIVGLIRPDRGKVFIGPRDVTSVPMYKRARAGIGYLAQEPSIFRRLTVEENVMAILQMMKLSRAERKRRLEELLDELGIKHLRKTKAYALSGGERRRLEITRALVSQPRFMLLDEPFAGVDPIAVHDIQQIVSDLRRRGIGVLISDHNVEQTLDIVDRAYIMYEGRVRVSGTVSELVWNDEVAEIYLGPTLTARMRERYDHPESEDAA